MKFLFLILIFLLSIAFASTDAEAQQKITGPWLWMIAPTKANQGGQASTDIDSLAEASGGTITEDGVAANGANEGDRVGELVWTLGKISQTGGNNVNDTVTEIGLGEGDINDHSSYALITLESDKAQAGVEMKVGSDDSIKVWLNGEVVHSNAVNRGAGDFQDRFEVNLNRGDNLLLVKVSERGGGWSMFVGISANVNAVYKPSRRNTSNVVPSGTLVSITSSSVVSPKVGEQFSVSIEVARGKDVAGYEMTLQFDPTAFSYITGANADYLAQPFTVPPVVSANQVSLAATSLGVLNQGDGTLATVIFEVLAVKDSILSLPVAKLVDRWGKVLPVGVESRKVIASRPPVEDAIEQDSANIPDRVRIETVTNSYISSNNVVEPKGGDFSGAIPLMFTVWSKADTKMRNQTLRLTVDSDIDASLSAETIRTDDTTNSTARATLTLEEASTGTKQVTVTAKVADISETLTLTIKQQVASLSIEDFERRVTADDVVEIAALVKSKNGTAMPNVTVQFTESSNLLSFTSTNVQTGADGKARGSLRTSEEGTAQFIVEVPGLLSQNFSLTIVPKTAPVDVPTNVSIVPVANAYISSSNIVEPKGGDFSGAIPLTFTVWSKADTKMRNQTIHLTVDSNINVSLSAQTIRTANTTNPTARATLTLEEASTDTKQVTVTAKVADISETLTLTIKQQVASLSIEDFERRVTAGDVVEIAALIQSKNGTVMPNVTVRFTESSSIVSFAATNVRTGADGKVRNPLKTGKEGVVRFTVAVVGLPSQTMVLTIIPKIVDLPARVSIAPTVNTYISSSNIVEPKGGDFSGAIPLTFTVWSKADTKMRNQTIHLTVDSDIDVSLSTETIQTEDTANATAKATLTLREASTGTKQVTVTAKVADISETLTLTVKQHPASLSVEDFVGHVISGDGIQLTALVRSKNGTAMPDATVRFTESSDLLAFTVTDVRTSADGKARSTLTTGGEGSTQFAVEVPGVPKQPFDVKITVLTNHEQRHHEFASRQGTKTWYGWQLDHYTIKKKFFFLGQIVEPPDVVSSVVVKGQGRLELIEDKTRYAENWVEVTIRAKEHREKSTNLSVKVSAKFERRGVMLGAPLASVSALPETNALFPNYPNPFNPETWIPYQLAESAQVTLTIYSANGELVRTLMLGYQAAGFYRNKNRAVYWDGRNHLGEHVASGVYFYTLTAGAFAETGKMLIIK